MDEIYSYDRRYDSLVLNIKKAKDLRPEDKEDLIGFLNYITGLKRSYTRKLKYAYSLRSLMKLSTKPLRDIRDRREMEMFILKLEQAKLTEYNKTTEKEEFVYDENGNQKPRFAHNTKRDLKIVLKLFFKWLRKADDGDLPPEVRFIKAGSEENRKWKDGDEITFDDLKLLVNNLDNPRDRALVAFLWAAGGRISEILKMQIKDYHDYKGNPHMKEAHLIGTKNRWSDRTVPIGDPYVLELMSIYLKEHPLRSNQNAPLWLSKANKRLNYVTVRELLVKLKRNLNFQKPLNPHWFRHSRFTLFENDERLTRSQVNALMGESPSSTMADVYSHKMQNKIALAFEKMYPITDTQNKQKGEEMVTKMLYLYFKNKNYLEEFVDFMRKTDPKAFNKLVNIANKVS